MVWTGRMSRVFGPSLGSPETPPSPLVITTVRIRGYDGDFSDYQAKGATRSYDGQFFPCYWSPKALERLALEYGRSGWDVEIWSN